MRTDRRTDIAKLSLFPLLLLRLKICQYKQSPGRHLNFEPLYYKGVLPISKRISEYCPCSLHIDQVIVRVLHVVPYLLFICVTHFSQERNSLGLYKISNVTSNVLDVFAVKLSTADISSDGLSHRPSPSQWVF